MRISFWGLHFGRGESTAIVETTNLLSADVLFFGEWSPKRPVGLQDELVKNGYRHQRAIHSSLPPLADNKNMAVKRWGILAAGREPFQLIEPMDYPAYAPACLLPINVNGVNVFGIRVVDFKKRQTAEEYWEWILKLASIYADQPTLLIGDFNAREGRYAWSSMQTLLNGMGWRDLVAEAGAEQPTFFSDIKTHKPRRLDYAIASPALAAASGSHPAKDSFLNISDHIPTVADLE